MAISTALAHPNIAFIKYWGNRNAALRLPSNGSISMNLDGLNTRTTVDFNTHLDKDEVFINGNSAEGATRVRVCRMLDEVRMLAGIDVFARVISENNFPTGTGIASSASGFAALVLAATTAAGLELSKDTGDPSGMVALSRLARHGSGSACRSIPGGFVEWLPGTSDADSYAVSIAPPDHWELVDCIALVDSNQKVTGSSEGHALADTSILQVARVKDAPRRLAICRNAIRDRDFTALTEVIEEDSNLLHAVMMSSHPPLFYWQPATLGVMQTVREARAEGLPACYTIDAGPNVHVICTREAVQDTVRLVAKIPGVGKVLTAGTGGPAKLIENPLSAPN
jgi:diphosphomevalonate decarboxylase